MVTAISLITQALPHTVTFMFVLRTFKSILLENFKYTAQDYFFILKVKVYTLRLASPHATYCQVPGN